MRLPCVARWVIVAVVGLQGQHAVGQTICTNTTGTTGTIFHCTAVTNCCPTATPICDSTDCVASCVFPRVRDARHGGFDDQCIPLQQGCGDNCVDCATDGACQRCQSDPLYRLEGTRCVVNCTSGQVASMTFTPLVSVVCTPAPPPTVRTDAPTITVAPVAAPTRTPTRIPTRTPTRPPVTRRPTSLAPTRIPTTRFPTGTRIRQTQTQTESSSPFDDTATVVVVAICAGSIVLLAAFAACYIGRDYCRQHNRYRPDPSGRVEVNEVTNATFFLDSGGGPPRSPDDGYLETTDTVEDGLESEAGVAMVAMPLASGSSDDTHLSGPEATEFFEWLTTLKKDRRVFAMLHREMRATQQSHTTAAERLRFSKPLSNFNRLADLFTHKKGQGVAPIDGMALLDWAQKTIDEFNAGG
eukprot:m.59046 g.59046  ORF g.59046 m.59046 type:complete len:412 (-) comp17286_c0_seq2:91-1326(-)